MHVQSGPLPVISMVLSPLIGVKTTYRGEETSYSFIRPSIIYKGPMSLRL